jgi:hypothetical protein
MHGHDQAAVLDDVKTVRLADEGSELADTATDPASHRGAAAPHSQSDQQQQQLTGGAMAKTLPAAAGAEGAAAELDPDSHQSAAVVDSVAGSSSSSSSSTASLLAGVFRVLDAGSGARVAAVLQLLSLQGAVSWHDPPLAAPQLPPAEVNMLLHAAVAKQQQQQQQG